LHIRAQTRHQCMDIHYALVNKNDFPGEFHSELQS
jgi:hypothetical protein